MSASIVRKVCINCYALRYVFIFLTYQQQRKNLPHTLKRYAANGSKSVIRKSIPHLQSQ